MSTCMRWLPANSVSDEVAIPGLARAQSDRALMVDSLRTLERYNVIRAVVSGPPQLASRGGVRRALTFP